MYDRLVGMSSVLGISVMVLIIYFLNKGSNVTRWIWTGLQIVGLGLFIFTSIQLEVFSMYGILRNVIMIASVSLLHVPISNAWFNSNEKPKSSEDQFIYTD